ncbi:MAG: hypothetical protein JWM21_3468 [Acidobacteria bacterium]|nr:hypothetical protein [Acidobacteriota bacterium]
MSDTNALARDSGRKHKVSQPGRDARLGPRPRWSAAERQDQIIDRLRAREAGHSETAVSYVYIKRLHRSRCRPLHGLAYLNCHCPGVPLRFNPGFMLPPACMVSHAS